MEFLWVEDLLPEGYVRKRMFGGYAYYLEEKLVLVMFESEGNKSYRGRTYEFEIWNGCMFPVDKEKHDLVREKFPFLINHPVLPKWFYVPAESEDFENHVQVILREIRRRNDLFGTVPKPKKGKSKEPVGTDTRIDTRRPKMFSDEPPEDQLKKAKRISDLKNLGPESEKSFRKAGIKTPQQLFKMGWKKAMVQLCKSDPRNNHSVFAYAVIGALQNRIWSGISEANRKEARVFMKSLREKNTPTKKQKRSRKRSSSTELD